MTTQGKEPLSQGGEGLDRFMGLGAFAEHVVVPEAMAVPIKTSLHANHACLVTVSQPGSAPLLIQQQFAGEKRLLSSAVAEWV